jgi:pimeloyl-ACP methyl ester carboxylesterase
MPWGLQIAHLVGGTERSFTPLNEAHERYWTTRYPMAAVLPMAATTDLAFAAPVEQANIPALFVFSDADQVVRAERTHAIAERWGATHEILAVGASGDPSNHVIAGDALSPQTTEALSQSVTDWLRRTLPPPG